MHDAPTCGSCFSGAGLLDCGLAMAGFEHAWVCESDEFRRGLLAKRFPGAVVYDDIRTLRGDGMPRLTDEQFAWACGMYDAGWSVADVAAELPVGRQALWQRFTRAGIEMRPQLRYGADNHFHRGGVFGEDWAHNKVEKAILRGDLVRPANCSACGGEGQPYVDGRTPIHAHHDDYNKPLDVRWLCQSCHHEWHKHHAPVPRAGGDANGSPIAESVDLIAGGFPLGPARAPAAPASRTGSSTPRPFCGTRCGASLARLDLATWSWKTSQRFSEWRLPQGSLLDPFGESWSATWPRSGSMCAGNASPPEQSERLTSETACSPSGSAEVFEHRPAAPRGSVGGSAPLLPSPLARTQSGSEVSGEGRTGGLMLQEAVLGLLPTPHGMAKEGQARRAGPTGNELGHALTTQLASTGATTSPPSPDGKPSTGLRLNPSFVGWMMGTPSCGECGREWTDPDCRHSAMAFMSTAPTSSGSPSGTTCSTGHSDDP